MNSRKVLGRGLDSLIRQDAAPAAPVSVPTGVEVGQIHWVPVDRIVPNPRQPRTVMDTTKLEELSRSIQEKGILEPLLVRPERGGIFELVAGERRLRAAQLAGRSEVPVIFRDMDERSSLEIALIENIMREDLNPVDEARAYQKLVDEFGRTHADISKEVGKDRTTITNLLRLLRLPETVLEDVSRGTISVGHARALLALESTQEQVEIARRIAEEGWSVRQVERHLAERQASPESAQPSTPESKPAVARDRQVVRVEEALQYALGTQVKLSHSAKGGKIEIRYFSNEELERILDLLGIEIH
ncbi:MAG: ParB/RepB/Spo0J family partition protein [Candidatus Eisenbacteria bacterium]|nr:ParB/RepB/Spo0J family partition protein [Candidatus Eisenbacteria bacterium]